MKNKKRKRLREKKIQEEIASYFSKDKIEKMKLIAQRLSQKLSQNVPPPSETHTSVEENDHVEKSDCAVQSTRNQNTPNEEVSDSAIEMSSEKEKNQTEKIPATSSANETIELGENTIGEKNFLSY